MGEIMEKKLREVFEKILGSYSIDMAMATAPRWDSLKHIQLLAALEKAFGITLNYKDTLRMTSVSAISAILPQYLSIHPKEIVISSEMLLPHQRIEKSIENNFTIEHPNIYSLFVAKKDLFPNKDFIFFPDKDESFTYQDFGNKVANAASKLQLQHRLGRGDRICLVIPTSFSFVSLYFAALAIGAVVVPINPDLSPSEMEFIIANSQAKTVFFDSSLESKVQTIGILPGVTFCSSDNLFSTPASTPSQNFSTSSFKVPEVKPTDEAVIIYTSGTTGNSKGVILTHLNLLADAKAISEWFKFSPATRALGILPLFHNNGQVVTLLSPLSAGGSTVMVQGKASLMTFWQVIEQFQVNWTSVMPSILSILLSLPLERRDTSMQGIICGGQPLTKEVQAQFEARFKIPVFEGYGLTETTSFACFNDFPAEKRKEGSIGKALPINNISICDDQDNEIPFGQEGEICIRGLNVANEYFMLPEKNQQTFRNGWFHSGDYGYMNADGYIYFKTRKDFLIIKGGENIYPSEIENVLFKHPAVAECAVIGIPSDLLGQEICAFVKIKEDYQKNLSGIEGDLQHFLSGKLAGYKLPKEIVVIDKLLDMKEIPKGPTKKVLYRILQKYYQENVGKGQ